MTLPSELSHDLWAHVGAERVRPPRNRRGWPQRKHVTEPPRGWAACRSAPKQPTRRRGAVAEFLRSRSYAAEQTIRECAARINACSRWPVVLGRNDLPWPRHNSLFSGRNL